MTEREVELVKEVFELAYSADACCDSEFRVSTDPPCEIEARLAEISKELLGAQGALRRWLTDA